MACRTVDDTYGRILRRPLGGRHTATRWVVVDTPGVHPVWAGAPSSACAPPCPCVAGVLRGNERGQTLPEDVGGHVCHLAATVTAIPRGPHVSIFSRRHASWKTVVRCVASRTHGYVLACLR